MPLELILASGETISADTGGPTQRTPEGFDTGLATSSIPLAQWDGSGASYTSIYETQVWVAIAVNFLTRQFSRIPLKVYEDGSQAQSKRRVTKGPLHDVIREPAPRKGPIHLKQWMILPTLLHGNGTVRKERSRAGATPSGFRPLDWGTMEPKEIEPGSGDLDYWKRSQPGKNPEVIDVDDVVHMAWHPPKGVLGVSPLKQLGVSLRIEKAAQAYQEALFRNSARPSGGVTLPESVAGDREFRKELRSDLATLHQGVDNAGRPVILPPGSKWEQFSITAHEAELIEQRKVGREEAAAIYNAPQPLIGILDHATYSNIAELHKILYGPVLGPWIVLAEETFIAQVIVGEPAFEGQFVEFDLSEELRGDVVKEAAALRMQMQSGILTINEARQIKNLPRIDHPDCDRVMVPTNNMTFVGGEPPDNDDPSNQALSHHLQRVGNHLWRKARAGEDGWNAERFERELTDDLDAAGAADPARAAKAWTGAIGAIVDDALNEPETLRAAFAALSIEIGGDG